MKGRASFCLFTLAASAALLTISSCTTPPSPVESNPANTGTDTTTDVSTPDTDGAEAEPENPDGKASAAEGTAGTPDAGSGEATGQAAATAGRVTLEPGPEITGPVPGAYITVFLERRLIALCQGRKYLRVYQDVSWPRVMDKAKSRAGDGRPPIGTFYLAEHEPGGTEPRLTVSYPSIQNAEGALAQGRIDPMVYNRIAQAIQKRGLPPQDTDLGGGIRFTPTRDDVAETQGGFAMREPDFQELARAIKRGAWVVIRRR